MFSPVARILILDTSSTARQHLASQLADIGFRQVTAVGSDTEAWELMQKGYGGKQAFHVVVCDWETAYGKVGFLGRLRADAHLKTMAVLVMLPEGKNVAPEHPAHLTVQGYLQKPTRLADLVRSLKHTDSEKTAA